MRIADLIALYETRGFPTKPAENSLPIALPKNKLKDFSKLKVSDGLIHYFLYQQDGHKQPMTRPDTPSNRFFISWLQIHDSPTTGNSGK